jgi:REP element-mobilizing transposase RayT
MPRAARCVIADVPLHIVQRGINRSNCFFADGDYFAYLRYLQDFSLEFRCSVHAYCLMTNHVHLLVTPRAPDACGLLMKKLGQWYVQAVNQRLCRTGTLWEGRFRSCMVSSDNSTSGSLLPLHRATPQTGAGKAMASSTRIGRMKRSDRNRRSAAMPTGSFARTRLLYRSSRRSAKRRGLVEWPERFADDAGALARTNEKNRVCPCLAFSASCKKESRR